MREFPFEIKYNFKLHSCVLSSCLTAWYNNAWYNDQSVVKVWTDFTSGQYHGDLVSSNMESTQELPNVSTHFIFTYKLIRHFDNLLIQCKGLFVCICVHFYNRSFPFTRKYVLRSDMPACYYSSPSYTCRMEWTKIT